jgi:hypothetical protein
VLWLYTAFADAVKAAVKMAAGFSIPALGRRFGQPGLLKKKFWCRDRFWI